VRVVVVVAVGAGGCGGSKVVTASGRGHGDVTPEGRCYRSMDDDISVEYFSDYLNLVCTSFVQNTQACSSLCTQGRHALELDSSNAN
jgi:hypothetical protein